MLTQTSRIPSLDGLRAFSISLVLFGHVAGTRNAYQVSPLTRDLALLGVKIFYLISGYLITFLLIRERQKTGHISLKDFYGRRAIRILPVFCLYLAAVAVLSWIGILHVDARDFLRAATFTANLFPVAWDLRHFWSLSTEEQFYLAWPTLLVLLGIRNSIKLAAVTMILSPFVSRTFWQLGYSYLPLLLQSVNALASGCVLAGLRPRLHSSRHYLKFLQSPWSLALGPIASALDLWHGPGGTLLFGVTALFGMIFVDRLITVQDSVAGLLNFKPIAFLGVLSYSLYIWQQMFLNRSGNAVFNAFPLNIILASTCALGSLFLIERPFLRFKKTIRLYGRSLTEPDASELLSVAAKTPFQA